MKITNIIALMFLITFASTGAVVFTAGLPQIATYFAINSNSAQSTVTWYLIGYALGQLVYGPLANRLGSKTTIIIGAIVATLGSIGCVLSYYTHIFMLLLISRVILALGAACGLKMTFTLTSKMYTKTEAARMMSIIMVAFALAPGISVYIGSLLVKHFNWSAPFYFMILYSIAILFISLHLPEAYATKDHKALNVTQIFKNYLIQSKNSSIILGGILIGSGTSIIYAFAAVAPFISMDQLHLSATTFGFYNIIPSFGVLFGSMLASKCSNHFLPEKLVKFGLIISICGVGVLAGSLYWQPLQPLSLFLPMIIIYFGFSFIFGNTVAIILEHSHDKANASALCSFINMGSAYLIVTLIGILDIHTSRALMIMYALLVGLGVACYYFLEHAPFSSKVQLN